MTKIAFIGDSITAAGGFVNLLDYFFLTRHPSTFELYNLGLSSETVSGLTEEEHKFPRPYLFDRLSQTLDYLKPDKVFICFGINCGIYQPYSSSNEKKYQEGIDRIELELTNRNIAFTFISPPPLALFEEKKAEIISHPPASYSWKAPYPHYDTEVIRKYVTYVLTKANSIDIHTPLSNHLRDSYGADPVHPNLFGHAIIASAILEHLKIVKPLMTLSPDNKKSRSAVLPFPFPPQFCGDALFQEYQKIVVTSKNPRQIGHYKIKSDQKPLKILSATAVSNKNDFNYDFSKDFVERGKELYELIAHKHSVYDSILTNALKDNQVEGNKNLNKGESQRVEIMRRINEILSLKRSKLSIE